MAFGLGCPLLNVGAAREGGPDGRRYSGGGSLRWSAPGAGLLLLATALGVVFAEGGTDAVCGEDATAHARLGGMDSTVDFILAGIPRPHVEAKAEAPPVGAGNLPVQQTGRAVPQAPPVAAAAAAPPAASAESGLQAASAGPARWEWLVSRYRWPVAEALSVLSCESRGDPAAYRAGNYGLFQINSIHAWRVGGKVASLFEPETNVRVAYDVWRDNAGWGPWACKP
jgi:hypothetical protein